ACDRADLRVLRQAQAAAGHRLCTAERGYRRELALVRLTGGNSGIRRMASADARAALRYDCYVTRGLYRDGHGEGSEAVAHSSGARTEAVFPNVGNGDRHQYRPADRRRR